MKCFLDNLIEVIGIDHILPEQSESFKQFQIQEVYKIMEDKPDIERILCIRVNAEVTESKTIDTPIGESKEGQVLLGKKIIIRGRLVQRIEYISTMKELPVYVAEFEETFSNYIVIEKNIDCDVPIVITPYIEDIFVKQISKKEIFTSISIIVNGVSPILNLPSKGLEARKGDLKKQFELSGNKGCDSEKERYYTQFISKEKLNLPELYPEIMEINTVIIEPEILSMKVIETIKHSSYEGQKFSGRKIFVELKVRQKILYSSDATVKSIHGIEKEYYHCVYVVVPEKIEGTEIEKLLKNKLLQPKISVEDVFVDKIDDHTILKNIIIFLEFIYIPSHEICYAYRTSKGKSNIYIIYENGENIYPINLDDSGSSMTPKWSPSGQKIAYIFERQKKFMLGVIDVNTSSKSLFLQEYNFKSIRDFCWGYGGNKLIFSAKQNSQKEIYIFDIESLKCKQLTNGDGIIKSFNPKCSPDGKKIAYFRNINNIINIWITDINGGDNRRITTCGYVKDFNWINNHKLIYVFGKGAMIDEIFEININTLEIKSMLKNINVFTKKKVVVSPCRRFIALIGSTMDKNNVDNLYLYELKSQYCINITQNIYETKISDIVWKIDSKKVYYVSNELGYSNIYSISLSNLNKKQLTNTVASDIQISYRPRLR